MSTMKRFTSYAQVSQGQRVFMKWPTEALPVGKTGLKWREGRVKSAHPNSIVVDLGNDSTIAVQNLTALHYLSDE